jgi:hypothetical protein
MYEVLWQRIRINPSINIYHNYETNITHMHTHAHTHTFRADPAQSVLLRWSGVHKSHTYVPYSIPITAYNILADRLLLQIIYLKHTFQWLSSSYKVSNFSVSKIIFYMRSDAI